MKRHGVRSPARYPYDNKTLLFAIYVIGSIVGGNLVHSYPSWDIQATDTDFGRNIRQLPCVSRRTGETGVCMFAYSCAKANGTHLGTCIDRFYFGSCCKAPSDGGDLETGETDNYLNNNHVDNNDVSPPPPSSSTTADQGHRVGGQQQSAGATASPPPHAAGVPSSSAVPHRPVTTQQFAVPSTSTSRYTDTSTTRPSTAALPSTSAHPTTRPPANSTTSHHTTGKPRPSTSQKPPSTGKEPVTVSAITTAATVQKTSKPASQPTAKPTTQFIVPTTVTGGSSSSSTSSPGHDTTKPATATSAYTSVTPLRPLGPNVTATYSTAKPVVRPSSTGGSTSSTTPPKVRPTTTAKPTTAAKPKPSSTVAGSSSPYTTTTTTTTITTNRSPVESVATTVTTGPGSTPVAVNSQTQTSGYSGSSSSSSSSGSTVTSTLPTLVTWTTLDKVPAISAENTRPPAGTTHQPSGADGSTTVPSWVKLPVETHEPNTAGTPPKESGGTNAYYSSTMTTPSTIPPLKTTAVPHTSDNDVVTAPNSAVDTNYVSEHFSSAQSSPQTASTTETMDAGTVPLNMSNYKDVCGRRLFPAARIVGGEKVTFGKWPWQISLRQWRTSTYLHKCGAALFNENWAVTAAHCVENVPPSDLLLRLGEHDLSMEEEPYGYEERRIQIVASHPQFDPRTFEYDLALLRFYEPVKFQPNIIPVCVPDDESNFVGSSAYVTGWGRLYEDGPLPSVLQEVTVPVINNSVCETMYRAAGYIEHIPDIFICAGWKKGGFDSCEGDSGGPMVIQRPDKRWLLAGIISWGIGCAEPNQPGVYTRISKFKDWINQILQF